MLSFINSLSLKADTVIDLSEQNQYDQGQGDSTDSFFDSDTTPEVGKTRYEWFMCAVTATCRMVAKN